MNQISQSLPVAVIGGGPIGMAAAAHLIKHGLNPIVLEAGPSVATNLESYRHVRLFSQWRYNLDSAARELLTAHGWHEPDLESLPTAGEIIDQYLLPLANLPVIAPHIRFGCRVQQITRDGFDKSKTVGRDLASFILRLQSPQGEEEIRASAVIDATGTWSQPNPLGGNGLGAFGEKELSAHVSYGMPNILGTKRLRYAGNRVLVVGTGHSAAGSLLALAELADQVPGTQIIWATRGDNLTKVFGGGEADGLPARGILGMKLRKLYESGKIELHTNFSINALKKRSEGIEVISEGAGNPAKSIKGISEIIAATGSRPELTMTRELRLDLDFWLESTKALAPLIDPNVHSCGTVRPHGHRELSHPETGYYAIGAKSYGRAPNFLLATGYEQARSVVAALAGDFASADDVQLVLPETGVCSIGLQTHVSEAPCCGGAEESVPASAKPEEHKGCCGGPAPETSSACCLADSDEKAKGNSGCGCSIHRRGEQPFTPDTSER